MTNFLRGEDEEVASFFAFQDAITAVLGILILIALFLSFSINVVQGEYGSQTAPVDGELVTEEEFNALQSERTEMTEKLVKVRERNQILREERRKAEGAALSQEELALAVEILKAEVSELQANRDALEKTVAAKRAQLAEKAKKLGLGVSRQRIESLTAEMESIERANEGKEKKLMELESQLSQLNAEVEKAEERKSNSIWVIPEPDSDGKKSLLVTVNNVHIRFEEFQKPESLRPLDVGSLTSSFSAGVLSYSPEAFKIVFMFKPSGAKYFEELIQLAKDKGFQVGYDAIEESKEVMFSQPE